MTKIDFHILPDTSAEARWLYACKLIEKVQSIGHSILVAVDSLDDAQTLDDLLWSFKPESFIAHQIIGGENSANVEITYTSEAGEHRGVLVNLSGKIPDYFSRFDRLCEIVIQEPNILESTREHYKFYKQRGYPIEQHKR